MALDDVLRRAFQSFGEYLDEACCFDRERDLVNRFAFGFLAPLAGSDPEFQSPMQLAIESAVPQHRSDANPNPEREVAKDLIIWHDPRRLGRDVAGVVTRPPRAVLEWKSLHRHDRPATCKKKLDQHRDYDLGWLVRTTQSANEFTGYNVLVDVRSVPVRIQCARVRSGHVEAMWFTFGSSITKA